MTNILYVANLPLDTTEDAVRAHFSTCGGVLDVELASARRSGARSDARVTMTSPAFADAAVQTLDHISFEGRELRVSHSPIRADARPSATVSILQQFRERANMAYDLDCAGMPLTVRIFPSEDGERWRIEACSAEAADAGVITAVASTRREAVVAALRAWNERASSSPSCGRPIDADGVTRALSEVKAI